MWYVLLCLIKLLKHILSLLISGLYINVIQFQIFWYNLDSSNHCPCLLALWFFLLWLAILWPYLLWNIQSDPELAQAILGNDLNRLQEILRMRHRQRDELRRQKEEELVSFLHGDYCFFSFVKKFKCIITKLLYF